MEDVRALLAGLKTGKQKRIRNRIVKRLDGYFLIDGDRLDLEDSILRLDEQVVSKSNIDYNNTVFLEIEPFTKKTIKTYRLNNKTEHTELISQIISRKNQLWYGSVVQKDGLYYVNKATIIVEFDTVSDKPQPIMEASKPKWSGGLSCPFCSKPVSSISGRTLHVKHSHPERFDEYEKLTVETVSHVRPPVYDVGEEDAASFLAPVRYNCPYCDCICSKQFGLTLHIKSKHPERMSDYKNG